MKIFPEFEEVEDGFLRTEVRVLAGDNTWRRVIVLSQGLANLMKHAYYAIHLHNFDSTTQIPTESGFFEVRSMDPDQRSERERLTDLIKKETEL